MARLILTLPQALSRALSAYNEGKLVEAEQLCQYMLSAKHDFFDALHLLAVVQLKCGKIGAALASCDRALAVQPNYAETLYNRGIALHELKRFDEALASYDHALTARPNFAEALYNRGNTLMELKRLDEALASFDRALTVKPDHAKALNNRGNVLRELKRLDESLASYDHALTVRQDYAEALYNRGNTLMELKRLDEALASFDRALNLQPDVPALSGAADCLAKICDWNRRTRLVNELKTHIARKKSIISPLVLLVYSGDPAMQLQCARNYIEYKIPLLPRRFWSGETWHHDKLRLAYLSADFRDHPVAHLSAGLFELHDRQRFEVIGVSLGSDDRSEVRARLNGAFDRWHDVRAVSDRNVAKLLYDLHVDIAVDLSGYTNDSRPEIFAHRPAPIQVSYLGFPATMGAKFIDYIIADPIILPIEQQFFYTEKIVHLPDCYQVNDSKRTISARQLTRAEVGLPAKGFVFCCFNNNWKIAPEIFNVWMRLLKAVVGSVLWLAQANSSAVRNLRREAEARGVDAGRLIFAPRLARLDDHLARHRLADLFLDTLPYNAHSTASDALWAGLPVLTCKGGAFAGRVTASLLHAVGVTELITSNLEDYEALALKLSREPALLARLKSKLELNRNTYPLFNTARFTKHIEAAYTTMYERHQAGLAPDHIVISN